MEVGNNVNTKMSNTDYYNYSGNYATYSDDILSEYPS